MVGGPTSEFGIDLSRLAVMGDSAGGGLAASLAILARDRHGPAVAHQILLSPMLDDSNSIPDDQITAFAAWTFDDNATGWGALLSAEAGGPDVSSYAAAARLTDGSGLPLADIEVAQLDIFRDENLDYARRLGQAGVPVEFHLHPGVPHKFDSVAPDADVSRRAVADRVRVLKGPVSHTLNTEAPRANQWRLHPYAIRYERKYRRERRRGADVQREQHHRVPSHRWPAQLLR